MKVGILTFQRSDNPGAALQCYALYRVCKKYESETYVIDYLDENERNKYSYFPRGDNWRRTIFNICKGIFRAKDIYYVKKRFRYFRSKSEFTSQYTKEQLK